MAVGRWIILGLAALLVAGTALDAAESFDFNPDPGADQAFIARASVATAPGLKVSVSALGAEEARRSFGAPLSRYGIQPIWIDIRNDTEQPFYYLPVATDPDYFSPYEVSFRTHGLLSFAANAQRDAFFLSRQIATSVPPRGHVSGFVYGEFDAGVKYVRVWLAAKARLEKFDFVVDVPGPAFVGESVRLQDLYPGRPIVDQSLDGLRNSLAGAPCCTANVNASRDGDPLNLVVVEGAKGLLAPFAARGWHMTQKLDVESMIETVHAFLFRDPYLTSPVSPLFLFGRREDVALQKARSTINERIHLRLWLTPQTFNGRRVWMGQVSRDIGVELTDKVWNLTTHKIGPDVDFDRGYLLQDLLLSGMVERFGFVRGFDAAPMDRPRENLTGDPYFSDGLRLVVFLSGEARPLADIDELPWERP